MKVICAEALSLGKGPVWDPRDGVLWFVDIKAREVHPLDPASGDHRRWSASAQIGWIFPARDGTMLAGLKAGLSRFDLATGVFHHLAGVERDLPSNRLNDATVAPDGSDRWTMKKRRRRGGSIAGMAKPLSPPRSPRFASPMVRQSHRMAPFSSTSTRSAA